MSKTKKDIEQNSNLDNMKILDKKIIDYQYTMDSINSWIISADNKVSIYCGTYSVVIAVITFVAKHVLSAICVPSTINNQNTDNQVAYYWFVVMIILALLTFLASIIFYMLVVKPNLIGNQSGKGEHKLSLFYTDVAKFESVDAYINVVTKYNRENYYEALLEEIYYNSKVCDKKMHNLQIAVLMSTISVFMIVFACVAYYFYCS